MRNCKANLRANQRPVVITTENGRLGFLALAQELAIDEKIEVLEIEQFLTANIYTHSAFAADRRNATIRALLDRYNEIIDTVESDPSLRIELGG